MTGPTDNPLVPSVGGAPVSVGTIQEKLASAATVAGPLYGVIAQSIQMSLASAQAAVGNAFQTLATAIDGQLAAVQQQVDALHNVLDTAILGHAGAAYGIAGGLPGVTIPTAADLQSAELPLANPTPTSLPPAGGATPIPATATATGTTAGSTATGTATLADGTVVSNDGYYSCGNGWQSLPAPPYANPPTSVSGRAYPGQPGLAWTITYNCPDGIGRYCWMVGYPFCAPPADSRCTIDNQTGPFPYTGNGSDCCTRGWIGFPCPGPSPPPAPPPTPPPAPPPAPPPIPPPPTPIPPPLPSPSPPPSPGPSPPPSPGPPGGSPPGGPCPPPTGSNLQWVQGCVWIGPPPDGWCAASAGATPTPPGSPPGCPPGGGPPGGGPGPIPPPSPYPPPGGPPGGGPPGGSPPPGGPPGGGPPGGGGGGGGGGGILNPPAGNGFTWPQWCDTNVWQQVTADTAALQSRINQPFWVMLGVANADGSLNGNSFTAQIIQQMPNRIQEWVETAGNLVGALLQYVQSSGGIDFVAMSLPAMVSIGMNVLDKFTGIRIKGVQTHADYWINAISPDLIPSTGEFNRLLDAALIDHDQWKYGVRANNDCDSWQELIRDADRTRPTYDQMWQLFYLDKWGGEPTVGDVMSYGFTRSADQTRAYQLRRDWPGWSETIEWALRGAFDESYAFGFHLDDELDDTLQAAGRGLAAASGTDLELLKYRWRAHWRLPTTAEALEMAYRLSAEGNPGGIQVNPEIVMDLLAKNGVAPGWRDILLELARPRLSRRELSVLYTSGAITYDRLKTRLLALGYPDELATSTADGFRNKKRLALSKSEESKAYVRGGLSEFALRGELQTDGAEPADADWVVAHLKREADRLSTEKVVQSYGHAFAHGYLPIDQVPSVLTKLGLDLDTAVRFQRVWQAELLSAPKHVEAAELIRWYLDGLLTVPQLTTSVANLNYPADQVQHIVAMAEYQQLQKVAAEQAKLTAAQQRQRAAVAKAAKQAAAAAAAATKAAEKLRIQATKAAAELSALDGISAEDARIAVASAIAAYRTLPGSTDTGAVSVIKGALALHKSKGGPSWQEAVDEYLADLRGQ